MLKMKTNLILAALIAVLFVGSLPAQVAPTITQCTADFFGTGMAINHQHPHDAFISFGPVVKHVSHVRPGAGPCGFGPLLSDISLGPGINASGGIALDRFGNLYVAAGTSGAATSILKIAPPYTGSPTVFFSGASQLSGLAIRRNILYAADFVAGKVLRFNLNVGPSSEITFATVPTPVSIFVGGRDDIFVTSNGTGTVQHFVRKHPGSSVEATTIAEGLSFPEGLGGDDENLYIAAAALVFTVPRTGGTPRFYAGSPILFSHVVFVFEDGGYVTDSNSSNGHVFKFTLIDDDDHERDDHEQDDHEHYR